MKQVEHVLLWMLIGGSMLTATLMIAVGMFEELPGMIRGTWDRSFRNH